MRRTLDSAISDYTQAALILKYNQRCSAKGGLIMPLLAVRCGWRKARLIAGLRMGECLLCERSEQGILFLKV